MLFGRSARGEMSLSQAGGWKDRVQPVGHCANQTQARVFPTGVPWLPPWAVPRG
jgi:hypothetical protein